MTYKRKQFKRWERADTFVHKHKWIPSWVTNRVCDHYDNLIWAQFEDSEAE